MKPTRQQIERAADAIKFLVPLKYGEWTEKGIQETKWPSGFFPKERKLIRAIAKKALEAAR